MPKILDKSRPYAEVYGLSGVAYEQDGLTFNRSGKLSLPISHTEEVIPKEDKSLPPSYFTEEQPSPPQQDEISGGTSIETMHWKHLKTLVESYGGEWNNRQEAIVFLKRGKK